MLKLLRKVHIVILCYTFYVSDSKYQDLAELRRSTTEKQEKRIIYTLDPTMDYAQMNDTNGTDVGLDIDILGGVTDASNETNVFFGTGLISLSSINNASSSSNFGPFVSFLNRNNNNTSPVAKSGTDKKRTGKKGKKNKKVKNKSNAGKSNDQNGPKRGKKKPTRPTVKIQSQIGGQSYSQTQAKEDHDISTLCAHARKDKLLCYCLPHQLTNNGYVGSADCWIYDDLFLNDSMWRSLEQTVLLRNMRINVQPRGYLDYIPTQFLRPLRNLSVLIIENSHFGVVPPYAFAALPTIKSIQLKNGELEVLDKNAFVNHTSLIEIRLENNYINNMHSETFRNLPNIQNLNLSSNNLTYLRMQGFFHLNKLQKLDLSYNFLIRLEVDMFEGLSNLKVLKLTRNNFEVIEDKVFAELWSLEQLELDDNAITRIAERALDGLNALKILNLRGNHLRKLDGGVLRGVPALLSINLQDNNLETLTNTHVETIMDNLVNKSSELLLNENNLFCDCRLAWVVELRNYSTNMKLKDALDDVECAVIDVKQVYKKLAVLMASLGPKPTKTTTTTTTARSNYHFMEYIKNIHYSRLVNKTHLNTNTEINFTKLYEVLYNNISENIDFYNHNELKFPRLDLIDFRKVQLDLYIGYNFVYDDNFTTNENREFVRRFRFVHRHIRRITKLQRIRDKFWSYLRFKDEFKLDPETLLFEEAFKSAQHMDLTEVNPDLLPCPPEIREPQEKPLSRESITIHDHKNDDITNNSSSKKKSNNTMSGSFITTVETYVLLICIIVVNMFIY